MKAIFILLFFIILNQISFAQEIELTIVGQTKFETNLIDSIQYISKHNNLNAITKEIKLISSKLTQIGYLENSPINIVTLKDSIYQAQFSLGEKTKWISISIGSNALIKNIVTANISDGKIDIPYQNIEAFLKQTLEQLEQKGFSLAELKLINLEKKDGKLTADLKIELNQQRILSSIKLIYPETMNKLQFPAGHLKQVSKKYRNTVFTQKILSRIHDEFNTFSYVNQIKYPEILFTKDTTSVFVYLEKRSSNTFDGFLGFANDDNKKIIFTGYLDISLENILQRGEKFSVFWKSDGKEQKTFKTSLELPYLFRTPFGIKAQLNIFRQDSTYQTTDTKIDLSYYINYNARLYMGYHITASSDIQKSLNASISDFNTANINTNFEYIKQNNREALFPIQSKFSASISLGKREISEITSNSKDNQLAIHINVLHTFNFNKRNSIYLNSQNSYLQSKRYIINELFRFGGLNSVRGFAENSLQGYYFSNIQTEYRYIVSPNLYAHTLLDYSILKNKTLDDNLEKINNLIGLGLGIGLKTKNGLFKLAFANGRAKRQEFVFSNTITHVSYNVKF